MSGRMSVKTALGISVKDSPRINPMNTNLLCLPNTQALCVLHPRQKPWPLLSFRTLCSSIHARIVFWRPKCESRMHRAIEGSKKGGGTYYRSASSFLIKSISYDKLLGFGHQGSNEFIVNSILDINSRSSCAVLACVVQDTQDSPVRGYSSSGTAG